MSKRLQGKRVLVTDCKEFMGPAIVELFSEEGADVVADARDLTQPGSAAALIDETGHIDVLVANLAAVNPRTSVADTSDEQWHSVFDRLVHPLHHLVRGVVPQMLARRKGKIVVMGSASALRGMPDWSAYSAARGAQLAFVQAVGIEVARSNVQINAIAQTFIDNPSYFSAEYQQTEEFAERMKGLPIGRLATGREDAALALFLASDESDFFVGQTFPFAGGWVTR